MQNPFFEADIWTDPGISDIHIGEGLTTYVRDPSTKLLPVSQLACPPRNELEQWLTGVVGLDQVTHFRQRLSERQECDFSLEFAGFRWRANLFSADPRKLKLVLRRIPRHIPRIDDLGLPLAARNMVNVSRGLVLVCGATGQGKSTTQAAIVDNINAHKHAHIITIEDPLEFVHKNKYSLITHREVGQDTLSFQKALISAVRQDPDVIVVGELRDPESVAIALEASNTGHLVLATVHASAAHMVIERLLSFYTDEKRLPMQKLLAASLRGVLCQNILPSQDRRARLLACEVLVNTQGVRANISEGKIAQIPNTMALGAKDGQLPLNAHLVDLVKSGRVNRDDALAAAYEPTELLKLLGGNAPPTGTNYR